jgi:RecJ-like exonuclease
LDDDKELPSKKPHSDEITVYQKAYNELLKENDKLREDMEAKIEEARVQKVMLTQERKQRKDLVTEQTNYYARRNQLEELFLECVEEVRRDISRRKASSIGLHGDLTATLKKAGKEHFTATDKRKVLDLLLSNENVLLFLYEKLFPRPIAN